MMMMMMIQFIELVARMLKIKKLKNALYNKTMQFKTRNEMQCEENKIKKKQGV